MNDLTPRPHAMATLTPLLATYAASGWAPATIRAYRADMWDWADYCEMTGQAPMPATPEVLAAYLAERAESGTTVATLARRISALRAAHDAAGVPPPVMTGLLRRIWKGIRRQHGRPPAQKKAAHTTDIRGMLGSTTGDGLTAIRDRALLAVGWGGALRRGELAALTLSGPGAGPIRAEVLPEGIKILLDRSKGDQTGKGQDVAIPRSADVTSCPVRAMEAWIAAAGVKPGGLLWRSITKAGRLGREGLTGRTVARIVQAAAARAGLDPALYGGHSLRSGLATSAAEGGAPAHLIMRHLRHARFDTTARYIRAGNAFKDSALPYAMGAL